MTQPPRSRYHKGRRGFLADSGAAAVGTVLGLSVPFARHFPAGLVPVALAAEGLAGKDPGLITLNDRPLNAEVPAHLLDDEITPAHRMFVRNNGIAPATVDPATWTLTIDGEAVNAPVTLTLQELQKRFRAYTYQLTLECGGNGRAEFRPNAKGNQWTTGAVSSAEWTGARLRDVLQAAGVKPNAKYVGYYGADTHLSGNKDKVVISRGVPLAKANQPETLVAWAMNGEAIPALHGAPLRLVAGGFPASASGKWLTRLAVRDRVHDGPKMEGHSYRVPCRPVAPGEDVPDEEMCIIESMPVKSLITFPGSGLVHPAGKPMSLRGHAWAGELAVKQVEVSIDFGATWQRAKLRKAKNRLAWQHFETRVAFPEAGYYEVWARATDARGQSQPMVVPGWNPKGYLNNACHRIAVRVS